MSQRYTSVGASIVAALPSDSPFTYMGWAYLSSASGAADVIYGDNNGGFNNSQSMWLGFNAGFWVWEQNAGGAYSYQQGASLNTWTHLAMVYDGTNTVAYVNGVAVDTQATGFSARGNFDYLGTGSGGGTDCTLQDLKVFTAGLTQAQVAREMRVRVPGTPSVYVCWPLRANAPTQDISGRGLPLSGPGNSDGTVNAPAMWAGYRPLVVLPSAAGPLAATAAGLTQTTGTATAGLTFAATAAGLTQATGAASSGLSRSATAAGLTNATGAAAAGLSKALTAAGLTNATGAAAAAQSVAMTAAGLTQATGAAIPGLSTHAAGLTQTTGTAAGSSGGVFFGVTAGLTQTTGAAVAQLVYAATAAGLTQSSGAASGSSSGGGGGGGVGLANQQASADRRWLGALGTRRRVRR